VWPTNKDSISIELEIEIVEYTDYPVPFFEARCKKLDIIATGETSQESKENLLKSINNKTFIPRK